MQIAVIGRGLIGSAAARHLAEEGYKVTLIGPSEPADYTRHTGVFASHYDEGRITRGMDQRPFWSRVSRASIARYRGLEEATGVSFYTEAGTLMVGPEGSAGITAVGKTAARDQVPCERMQDAALAGRFPFFRFDPGTLGYFEAQDAGYISPRNLVRAQGVAVQQAGGRIIDAEVTGLDETPECVILRLGSEELRADKVLIAAGGFTNGLLQNALPLAVYARTVALFEVSAKEAARLCDQPSMIYLGPGGEDPYLLPPIRYPDGKTYLKLGGDVVDVKLESHADRIAWFQSGGDPEVGKMLTAHIHDRMPGLEVLSTHIKPCVTTYTLTHHPIIDQLGDRIAVAVGGNGRGAKNSDELGRLGGRAVLGDVNPALSLAASLAA
ncbi:MAG: FAD-dependent oxidoreductase [Pseudomonadota bacterium]